MTGFVWNEYEFVECLGVLPEVDGEDDSGHTFKVERDGLVLSLTVFDYAGDVYVELYREGLGAPVFSMRLLDCKGARYVSEKRGDFIEFAPANSFFGRQDGGAALPFGFRVSVNPHIRIEPFSREGAF